MVASFQQLFATPQCFCEIYPHEGGSYSIPASQTGAGQGQILSLSTRKFIKEPAGSFTINLAPGGPNGPNAPPYWIDIITPMSFVIIGMSRGQYSGITMIGVVTKVSESWSFPSNPGETVRRVVVVSGFDFGYFFTHFNWYALLFLNVSAAGLGAAIAAAGGSANQGAVGTLPGNGGGLNQGTPDAVGAYWFKNVMDGGQGILSQTWVRDGTNQVSFSQAVQVQFEQYIASAYNLFSFSNINTEENWYDKFNRIFPYPFYEFFIMTAPVDFYLKPTSTAWNQVNTGQSFSMQKLGTAQSQYQAQINVIARVNPLPLVKPVISGGSSPQQNVPEGPTTGASAQGQGTGFTIGTIDMTAWNNLTTFYEDTSLIRTTEEFTEEEVRNFYLINPTFQQTMLGQSNSAVTPPILTFQSAVDPASVHRYGFRPIQIETEWLADPTGGIGVTQAMDVEAVIATMTMQLASQYEPTSLMMRAAREGTLRPDIIPGNKFQYTPLKGPDQSPWLFYIEGVEHTYVFGGQSKTLITMSRGLPASVYANSDLLTQIHTGKAQRMNGTYQSGIPSGPNGVAEDGLEVVSLLDPNVQSILAEIAPIYSTPGKR